MLEIVGDRRSGFPVTFDSNQPFGAFEKGDRINLVGPGGSLISAKIEAVEHTVWIEHGSPVHKVQLKAS
jgi:hypothetical protein